MSKSNAFEEDIANLIFLAQGITGIAVNPASAPLTDLWFSLHTADPGEAGDQTTNETSYGGYVRVSVPRSSAGFWTQIIAPASPSSSWGCAVYLQNDLAWPAAASGPVTLTHVGIGTASSGAGKLLYKLGINGPPTIDVGMSPVLSKSTSLLSER